MENEYKYKTKEYSADTGLVYFGARYYDPLIGRFITQDPLGMADGVNLYLYCGNDPVNFIDPYGLCGDTPWYFAAGIYPLAFPGFADDAAYWGAVGTGLAIWGIYEGSKAIVNWAKEYGKRGSFENPIPFDKAPGGKGWEPPKGPRKGKEKLYIAFKLAELLIKWFKWWPGND